MKNIIVLLSIISYAFITNAQTTRLATIERFQEETKAKVTINRYLQSATFIKFPRNQPLQVSGNTYMEKINRFLKDYQYLFTAKEDQSYWLKKEQKDDPILSNTIIILNQYKNEIPVYGSQLKFHFDSKMHITAINGFVFPHISSKTKINIKEEDAKAKAIHIIASKYQVEPSSISIKDITLMHYQKGTLKNQPSKQSLVIYHIEINGNNHIREVIFLDANTGAVIDSYKNQCNALHREYYSDVTLGSNNLIWEEGDAFPGTLDEEEQKELTITAQTYHFFKTSFGQVSYDNNDAIMKIARLNDLFYCPNAYWDGQKIAICSDMGSDDVIGHEWAHAYTEYTSGLIYAWQSGALNEAFSDIWGETIDLINDYDDENNDNSVRLDCNNSHRWLMGENTITGALRDMWMPSCLGYPSSIVDELYLCDESDNGGVHTNSSIANYSYSLLADGGSYNNTTINSIGLTKAAHIYWRTQNIYLNPNSNFADFADALESACSDLIGTNLTALTTTLESAGLSNEIISEMDCEEIAKVIEALSLKVDNGCDEESFIGIVLNPEPPELECNNQNIIFFEDFESGMDNWTNGNAPLYPESWEFKEWTTIFANLQTVPSTAIYIDNSNIGDCSQNFQGGLMWVESPSISFPVVDNTNFFLSFQHYVNLENFYDGGNLKYSTEGGASNTWNLIPSEAFIYNSYNKILYNDFYSDNPLQGQPAFSGNATDGNNQWGESHIDLSLLGIQGGDDVIFKWEFGEDCGYAEDGWYVDDITVYSCGDESLPPVSNENLVSDDYIHVSPNPFNSDIRLEINASSSVHMYEISIIDLSGKVIYSDKVQNNAEEGMIINNLDKIASGVYILNVQGNDYSYSEKIVKL